MKTLAKFFDSPIAPILLSFIVLFLYTYLTGTEFYTAIFGSAFFSIIGGWIFATPITYFLASILDSD
jgi:hypothetical protein